MRECGSSREDVLVNAVIIPRNWGAIPSERRSPEEGIAQNWAELGRIGQNWAELGRIGQNWTELGRMGRIEQQYLPPSTSKDIAPKFLEMITALTATSFPELQHFLNT